MSRDVASRARALIGTPFRWQGRDPQSGLDCLGVVASALELDVTDLPSGYRTARVDRSHIDQILARHMNVVRKGSAEGDVLIFEIAKNRFHLCVDVGGGEIVHADLRYRTVVKSPVPSEWEPAGRFRARVMPSEG